MLATKATAAETNVATTYYINPASGNDGNTGHSDSPWKTLAHAFKNVSDGDTIILQDGTYIGEGQSYVTLEGKSNITIRAENKQRAILDGSWGPELVDGDFYKNIDVAYWDNQPAWLPEKNRGKTASYSSLLTLDGCENATIDGLRIQNSIGIGISVRESVLSLSTIVERYLGKKPPLSMREVWQASNVPLANNSLQGLLGLIYISASETHKRPDDYPITTIRNCVLDWCHFGAFKVFYGTNRSLIEGNTMTRCAFDWWINRTPEGQAMPTQTPEGDPIPGNVGQYFAAQRKGTRPGPMWKVTWDKKKEEWVANGNFSAVILWGNNSEIRNNVIAFSFGEVSPYKNSSHLLMEGNTFIGNHVNCYMNGQTDATVRNNLLVGIPGKHDQSTEFYRGMGSTFAIRNEYRGYKEDGTPQYMWEHHLNDDLRIYNNLMLFGDVWFSPLYEGKTARPIGRFYFGHNTIVGVPDPNKEGKNQLLVIYSSDKATISGILENCLWDDSLFLAENKQASWSENPEGFEKFTIRNCVFPNSAPTYWSTTDGSKQTDVVQFGWKRDSEESDDWLDELRQKILPPTTSINFEKMQAHLKSVTDALDTDVHRFRPMANAVAVNGGFAGLDAPNNTPVPPEAHDRDYFGQRREGAPDIGAVEYLSSLLPAAGPSRGG